jgi:hypothetical protein
VAGSPENGDRNGGGKRGLKNPFWPANSARIAAAPFCIGRNDIAKGSPAIRSGASGQSTGTPQIVSQKLRSRSIRSPSGEPAITAAFNAPIEMPAIQFGRTPASCKPS